MKTFVREYQKRHFTDSLRAHFLELGCYIEEKTDSVEIWYTSDAQKAA